MLKEKRRASWAGCLFAIAASSVLLCSCGSMAGDSNLAKQSVVQFHSQLDAGQYVALYAAADPELHKITPQDDFAKLLAAIHRKLGDVKQSNLRTWNTSWTTGQGTIVTLTYDTTFSMGSGTEQFQWHISDNRAWLLGYHINSADLVEK